MSNPILIIHGWSDTSKSFERLRDELQSDLKTKARILNLGEYITLDNDVTIKDIAFAMDKAVKSYLARINHPGHFDIIAHSTAGLVVRTWLYEYYKHDIESIPVDRIVMLAPANFGSPLAHKGDEIISVIVKGNPFKDGNFNKPFHVGQRILKSLELASEYSWDLAMRDRFNDKFNVYNQNKILCSVLIGNEGYGGLKAILNQNGSDGTVRVAAANMNCQYVEIDYTVPGRIAELVINNSVNSTGITGFCVIDKENHSSIIGRRGFLGDGDWENPETYKLIVDSLTVTKDTFLKHCTDLSKITADTGYLYRNDRYKRPFCNLVSYVIDSLEDDVDKYVVEFFDFNRQEIVGLERARLEPEKDEIAAFFFNKVIENVHPYSNNNSYRSFLIDSSILKYNLFNPDGNLKFENSKVGIRFSAEPQFDDGYNKVGYLQFPQAEHCGFPMSNEEVVAFLRDNTTTLLKMRIRREISDKVFRISQ